MVQSIIVARLYKHPLIWSNFFWIIPFFIALYYSHYLLAVLPIFAMCFSIVRHATTSKITLHLDQIFATSYVLVGPYLLWQVGLPTPGFQISALITVFALSSLLYSNYVRDKYGPYAYMRVHKWWHISSSSMAVAVYLTYFGVL